MEETYFGSDAFFSGNIFTKDNLHVDGRIEADIDSKKNTFIGTKGLIKGELKCTGSLELEGTFDGLMVVHNLFLYKNTILKGKVLANNMSVKKITKNIDAKIKIIDNERIEPKIGSKKK